MSGNQVKVFFGTNQVATKAMMKEAPVMNTTSGSSRNMEEMGSTSNQMNDDQTR